MELAKQVIKRKANNESIKKARRVTSPKNNGGKKRLKRKKYKSVKKIMLTKPVLPNTSKSKR